MEAEFAVDESSALSLFDCLVPSMKEFRRYKINLNDKFTVADFKVQQEVKMLEWDLHRSRMPVLIEDNDYLARKNEQLMKELEIVNWYIRVMEDGLDTKELIKKYYNLQQKTERLKRKTDRKIA
jgi:hypothetical protein